MRSSIVQAGSKALAAVLAGTLILGAAASAAQPYNPPPPPPSGQYAPPSGQYAPPPGQYPPPSHGPYDQQRQDYGPPPPGGSAPPQGQYAPPPAGYDRPGATYDDAAQRYDREYADRYSQWAAQNCVDRRNSNTAAGAVIGGILGAVVGSNVSGRGSRTGGSIVGGALGAIAGGAIGSSSTDTSNCPPGYMVRSGAPAFDYPPPAYGPAVLYGPSWYNPWFYEGGRYVYRPYRYWYWNNRTYWAPGYRAGRWDYHYRRW